MQKGVLPTSNFNFAILFGKVNKINNTKGKEIQLLSKKEIEMLRHIATFKPLGHNESVIIERIRLCLSYIS